MNNKKSGNFIIFAFILFTLIISNSCSTVTVNDNKYQKSIFETIVVVQVNDEKNLPIYNLDIEINDVETTTDMYGTAIVKTGKGIINIYLTKENFEKKKVVITASDDVYRTVITLNSFEYYMRQFNDACIKTNLVEAEKIYTYILKSVFIEEKLKSLLTVRFLYENAKYEEALLQCEQLYIRYPDIQFLIIKSTILKTLGNYKESIQTLQQVIKIDQYKYYSYYKDIGFIYKDFLQDNANAILYFDLYLEYINDESIKKVIKEIE